MFFYTQKKTLKKNVIDFDIIYKIKVCRQTSALILCCLYENANNIMHDDVNYI